MKPYYQDDWVTLYHGNALSVLMSLHDDFVDAVVSDPPYSSGGAFRGDRMQVTTAKYVQTGQVTHPNNFPGDNRDQRGYSHWCTLWLAECLRVVKPGGVCCVFTDWRQLPTTTDAFQAGGWVWRGIGVWDKTEAVRPQLGRFSAQCEYVIWGTHGPRKLEGAALPGVWRHAVRSSTKFHIAGKPADLMKEIIAICPSGSLVLDPFSGSGSTLLACRSTGRRSIGIEIDEHWCEVSAKRLSVEPTSLPRDTPPTLFDQESAA